MAKILLVGDLHLKKNNLEASRALLERIIEQSKLHDATVILGDLLDNHGITRADELKVAYDFVSSLERAHLIVGNHDLLADEKHTSLYTLAEKINIPGLKTGVEKLIIAGQVFGFISFCRSNDKFYDAVKTLEGQVNTIFCHQEFDGAQYENGFYAKHGAQSSCFSGQFISGHIHKISEFSNVFYAGSPWWLVRSDTGQERGIWSCNFEDGKLVNKQIIDSSDICPRFYIIGLSDEFFETGKPLPECKPFDRVYIEYSGDNDKNIKKIQKFYNNVSIRKKPKQVITQGPVSESKGFFASVVEYVKEYEFQGNKDELIEEINRRLLSNAI